MKFMIMGNHCAFRNTTNVLVALPSPDGTWSVRTVVRLLRLLSANSGCKNAPSSGWPI
ncbi:Uncharacterised protein [Klebsiella pneumoniae]|uniref:Uncharacterized protein n=1 Tax=Klebsiella pneumoniae TaxID=573 RepID=A0A378BLJ3_KLEPN|nr:Uncharacterised protein [Klebsiella pneumoniae]